MARSDKRPKLLPSNSNSKSPLSPVTPFHQLWLSCKERSRSVERLMAVAVLVSCIGVRVCHGPLHVNFLWLA